MLTDSEIVNAIHQMRAMFPEAGTTLKADTTFHFLLATILSAQSTDKSVNMVTPPLFARYPTPESLASAEPEDIEPFIQSLGLYHNKAKYLVKAA